MNDLFLLIPLVLVGTALLAGLVHRLSPAGRATAALEDGSAADLPVPGGGGLVVAAVIALGIGWLWFTGWLPDEVTVGLLGGGVLAASAGWLEDRGQMRALYRVPIQLAAAGWLLGWSLTLSPGPLPELSDLALPVGILIVLGIVLLLNLYTIMDSIEGLSAMQAATVAASMALVFFWEESGAGLAALCMVVAAAGIGVLYWNWPPARVLTGSGGSAFLGLLFGGLALFSVATGSLEVWPWLILLGVYIVDAGFALISRIRGAEPLRRARRTHTCLRLSRLMNSHRGVNIGVALYNLFWLLPLALFASADSVPGFAFLLLGWGPLILLCGFVSWLLPAE